MVIYFNPELDTLICKGYCHFLKLKLASFEVNVFKTPRRPEASVLLDQYISPEFLRIVKTMTFDNWPWWDSRSKAPGRWMTGPHNAQNIKLVGSYLRQRMPRLKYLRVKQMLEPSRHYEIWTAELEDTCRQLRARLSKVALVKDLK